jgi:alkaline phosphatase D
MRNARSHTPLKLKPPWMAHAFGMYTPERPSAHHASRFHLTRRGFLAALGSAIAFEVARSSAIAAPPVAKFTTDPFKLGVASGDPASNGIVLWTRLVLDVDSPNGGLTEPVPVLWEIASDHAMRHIVRHGITSAVGELGHSVHVEADGLKPATPYFYRFHAGGVTSPIGRTRTAPATGTMQQRTRFAFSTCQHYEYGYYNAYKHMAEDDVDAVLFLGDYIYEYHLDEKVAVRRHTVQHPLTVADYRRHYITYKSDPDLMAAHAAHPWIVTFDDHEVENNWAGTHPQWSSEPEPQFPERRASAFQTYYEHMPLRIGALPQQGHIQIYRAIPYGRLAQFTVVDTRQFRSRQPCHDGEKAGCEARFDQDQTMMGAPQEKWFEQTLSASPAHWNVIANQVMVAQLAQPSPEGMKFNLDQWDGYTAARKRLTGFLAERKPSNTVIVTGDVHQTFVGNIKQNFDDPSSPAVAAELVVTSITSGGNGSEHQKGYDAIAAANPHIVYNNSFRGYMRCELTPTMMTSELCVLPDGVRTDGTPSKVAARFVTESGRPGIALA